MKNYAFKIKKNNLYISLETSNKTLVIDEFSKFAMQFLQNGKEISIETNVSLPEAKSKKDFPELRNNPRIDADELKFSINKTEVNDNTISEKQAIFTPNFAKLLKEKSNKSNNVIEKRTSELKNAYIKMQNTIKEKTLKNEIDYIVAAAYCLVHYENALRFTEEQIKAKIAPFFDKELEHNFILDAVAKNLIKVLPDFTGFSDTIEFELTDQGEEYFLNEL